jgi:hypothetical protein
MYHRAKDDESHVECPFSKFHFKDGQATVREQVPERKIHPSHKKALEDPEWTLKSDFPEVGYEAKVTGVFEQHPDIKTPQDLAAAVAQHARQLAAVDAAKKAAQEPSRFTRAAKGAGGSMFELKPDVSEDNPI